MSYNRGEYLDHAIEELLKGKVWPQALRYKLENINATSKLYPIDREGEVEQARAEGATTFAAWLTTRDKVAGPFSAQHEAGAIAELVGRFCEANNWKLPPSWPGIEYKVPTGG